MGAAPSLIAAMGPGSDPLTLGSVTFASEECPSTLAIGGLAQMQAVHDPIGGGRVVHNLGIKPNDVGWTGTFWDQRIQTRVATLRAYVVAGTEIPVTWRNESYFAIVREFEPTYENAWICHYRIALTITRDGNGAFTQTTPPSVDNTVNSLQTDLANQNSALQAADAAGSSAMQRALTQLHYLLDTVGPLAQLTGTALTTVLNAVNVAQLAIRRYLATQSQSGQNFVTASRMFSIVSLIGANVARGQVASTVPKFGGSLFEVAASQYGDVTRTFDLASANGLNTPVLTKTALSTVVLPPFPTSS